jgi:hypothetical protein
MNEIALNLIFWGGLLLIIWKKPRTREYAAYVLLAISALSLYRNFTSPDVRYATATVCDASGQGCTPNESIMLTDNALMGRGVVIGVMCLLAGFLVVCAKKKLAPQLFWGVLALFSILVGGLNYQSRYTTVYRDIHEEAVVATGAKPQPQTGAPTPVLASASVSSTVVEPFAPSGNLEEKKFGDYAIRIYDNPDEGSEGALEILKLGTRVYTEQQASFQVEDTGAPIGADVTGAGIPNLVVREYSGGAHCCTSFVIFELGNTFRKVANIQQGDCEWGKFQKQNNGGYLFHGCDPSTAIGGSGREVILRYENGDFRLLK